MSSTLGLVPKTVASSAFSKLSKSSREVEFTFPPAPPAKTGNLLLLVPSPPRRSRYASPDHTALYCAARATRSMRTRWPGVNVPGRTGIDDLITDVLFLVLVLSLEPGVAADDDDDVLVVWGVTGWTLRLAHQPMISS